jgi:hypothetical protein
MRPGWGDLCRHGGARYAVNGLAITHNPELPRINRIWAPAPEDPALRMDISPVLIGAWSSAD